jgi:hypothetical protein
MTELSKMSREELLKLNIEAQAAYDKFKAKNLKLDMSRGKPCPQQLDLTMDMLDCVGAKDNIKAADGTDCRNYGLIDGIPEAKELFASLLEVDKNEIIVGAAPALP